MDLFAGRRIGVDIGSTAVRVVELVGVDGSGFAQVRRATVVPMREGAIVAGEMKQPVVVGQALAEAIKRAGVPRQGFILGTSSRFATLGQLDSPQAAAPHERSDQIRLSRNELSPTVPLADSIISWNLIGPKAGTTPPMNSLNVALLLRRDLDELRRICKVASVQPQAIDLTAAGLLRALVRVTPDDTAVATIVDIGASKTIVATRQGPHLRSLRTIPVGGALITRSLMGAEDIDYFEAEDRKRYLRLPGNRQPLATGGYADPVRFEEASSSPAELALGAACDQIIEEIAKSITADSQAHQRDMTRGVQLTGGSARIPGLAERLEHRIGVPVRLSKPWAEVSSSKHTAQLFTHGTLGPGALEDLAAAIGLALWRQPQ